jgi:hypothetical protein
MKTNNDSIIKNCILLLRPTSQTHTCIHQYPITQSKNIETVNGSRLIVRPCWCFFTIIIVCYWRKGGYQLTVTQQHEFRLIILAIGGKQVRMLRMLLGWNNSPLVRLLCFALQTKAQFKMQHNFTRFLCVFPPKRRIDLPMNKLFSTVKLSLKARFTRIKRRLVPLCW